MNSAKLFVDGQEADFYKSEELAPRITKQIFDLSQLSGAAGDYTLSLVLPFTAANDRLFGWAGDVQAKQPFFMQARRKAVVEVDGQVVLVGSLSVESREKNGYGATILGTNIAWAEPLADRTLRDLSTFPPVLYTGIRSTNYHAWPEHIAASKGLKDIWQTSEGGEYEMQFPLIGYGNFDSPPDPEPLAAFVTAGSKVVTLDNPSDLVFVAPGQRIRGPGIPVGALVDFIGGGSTQQFDMTVAATITQFTAIVLDGTPLNPLNGRISVARSGGIVDGALIYNDPTQWAFDQLSFRGGAYMRDTIRRIFSEAGYRVGGTWYDDTNNLNLFIPYVDSGDAAPEWNWGTLGLAKARSANLLYYYFTDDNGPLPGPPSPNPNPPYPIQDGYARFDYQGTFFPNVHLKLSYYRVAFTDVRYDYSFAQRGPEFVAQVEQVADILMQVRVSQYRLFVASILGENVTALAAALPTSADRRSLLLLLKNPPTDNVQWEGIASEYLRNGVPLSDTSILAAIDLSAVATSYALDPSAIDNQGILYNFANGGNLELAAQGVSLEVGDRIVLALAQQARHVNDYSSPPPTDYFVVQQLVFDTATLTVSNIRKPDGTAYPTHLAAAALLPDMTQVDFVKSFIAQNNLFVATSPETKLVTLNYAETFLLPGETAVDWSAKTDMKQAQIAPACKYKRFVFEMADQQGEVILDWKKFRVIVSNDDRSATEDFSVKLAFAPTATRIYTWVQDQAIRLPLPCLNTAEELAKLMGDLGSASQQTKVDYTPRVLKWQGYLHSQLLSLPGYASAIPFAVGAFTSETLLSFPMNIGTGDAFVPGEFYLPLASVPPNFGWPGADGFYDKYYAASVRALLKAVKATAMVMLSPNDMQILDQRRPVAIDGVLYTANTIQDFNPVNPQPTKVVLIRRY